MNKIFPALFLGIALTLSAFAQKEKLTTEDVISRHLASVGTLDAIKAAKSRVLVGRGSLSSQLGYTGKLSGPAQMAWADDKVLLAIIFNSNDYPSEKLAYDGKDISYGRAVGNLTAGEPENVADTRSRRNLTLLGEFIKSQGAVVKSGLFGGVLSAAWPLAVADGKKYKAEYAGTESMNGRDLHKLKFRPSNAGDLRVSLFFDSQSFRHVATTYEYTIQPHLISSNSTVNATAKASHFTMTELFTDFKKVNDLTLPLGYTITVTNQYPNASEQLIWNMTFSQVFFNEPLEASVFKVS